MLIHHGFVWPSLGEAPHALAIFYSWFSERFSIHLQGLWMFMYVYGRYIELVTCWFINQQVFHLGDTTDTSGRWLLWAPGCGSRFCWSQNWGRLENLIQQETFRAFENQQVYIYISIFGEFVPRYLFEVVDCLKVCTLSARNPIGKLSPARFSQAWQGAGNYSEDQALWTLAACANLLNPAGSWWKMATWKCSSSYKWIYIYTYGYVCMYVRTYVRTYVRMYVCMYAWMYVCMHVCMYACKDGMYVRMVCM